MKISREDVLRVAELAHLELAEAELETYRQQLDSILTYVDKLNQLDTAGVEPMAQSLAAAGETALREDAVRASEAIAETLSGAPDPSPPYFRVPKVIDR